VGKQEYPVSNTSFLSLPELEGNREGLGEIEKNQLVDLSHACGNRHGRM
jgi:hypothetical protein